MTGLMKKEVGGVETVIGVTCKSRGDVSSLYAPLVISCDGHYSKFRKELVKQKPEATSSFAGIILDDVRVRAHCSLSLSGVMLIGMSSDNTRVFEHGAGCRSPRSACSVGEPGETGFASTRQLGV